MLPSNGWGWRQVFGPAIILATLVGCGGEPAIDTTRLPTELTPIDEGIAVTRLWRRSAGAGVGEQYLRLRPFIADETIFVADVKGNVTALQREDGGVRWRTRVGADVSGGPGGGNEIVVAGTSDGEVIALNRADGSERWRQTVSSEVTAVANEAAGVVVVRTLDGKLHGLGAENGSALWQLTSKTPPLTLRGASTPITADGRLLAGMDNGKLIALSPERGTKLWEATIAESGGRSELERMVDIDGEIKAANGVAYVASFQGSIAAVAVGDGRLLWSRELSSYTGLALDADHVYATDDESNVWAFDIDTGSALWKQEKLKFRDVSAPALIDEYVLVGDFEGYLHWLSRFDGRFVARTRIDDSGILSPPLVADGSVYALADSGRITALAISP